MVLRSVQDDYHGVELLHSVERMISASERGEKYHERTVFALSVEASEVHVISHVRTFTTPMPMVCLPLWWSRQLVSTDRKPSHEVHLDLSDDDQCGIHPHAPRSIFDAL